MIQQIIKETKEILEREIPTKQTLVVGVEIFQRYVEYLDELFDGDLLSQPEGVTVALGWKTITICFPTSDAFASWLAENMT